MNIVELTVRRFLFIIQKYSSMRMPKMPFSLRAWLTSPVKHRVTIGSCNNGGEQNFGSVNFDACPAKTTDICAP